MQRSDIHAQADYCETNSLVENSDDKLKITTYYI